MFIVIASFVSVLSCTFHLYQLLSIFIFAYEVHGINRILLFSSKLMVDDRGLTCKTLRARKSVNPVWDEQHVVEGISLETVKSAKLEIKVMHDVLSFNKSKRREILGTSTIESCSGSESVRMSFPPFYLLFHCMCLQTSLT